MQHWALHEALRCMFRNVVRCISLLRVEKVQGELLAYAGSSFFVIRCYEKNCGNARFFHATLVIPVLVWCNSYEKKLCKITKIFRKKEIEPCV